MEDLAGESRQEFVLQFKVENWSQLEMEVILEPTTTQVGLPFRLKVQPLYSYMHLLYTKALKLFLICDGDNQFPNCNNWVYKLRATLEVNSNLPGIEPFLRSFTHTFCSDEPSCGCSFIEYDEMTNLAIGCVKNDDFLVNAYLKIDHLQLTRELTNQSEIIIDPGKSKATLKFSVNSHLINISMKYLSTFTQIRNRPWRMKVFLSPDVGRRNRYLGIFLEHVGVSRGWSCKFTIRILTQEPMKSPLARKYSHKFTSNEKEFGDPNFISWGNLVDPKNGFLKANGDIEIELDVNADEPIRINNSPDEEPSQVVGLNVPNSYLECPVCYELPRMELFQCRLGHIICDACISSVASCPQCRQRFEGERIRNRALETILDDIEMKCRYNDNGCRVKLLRKLLPQHELTCGFQPA